MALFAPTHCCFTKNMPHISLSGSPLHLAPDVVDVVDTEVDVPVVVVVVVEHAWHMTGQVWRMCAATWGRGLLH